MTAPSSSSLALLRSLFVVVVGLLLPIPAFAQQPTETNCSDGKDDDGDTVTDCGDNDCHDDPVCQPDGKPETGEGRCGDWVDNDNDGFTDCDDIDCDGTEVCMGSLDLELRGKSVEAKDPGPDATPELGKGEMPEDLWFKGGDKDGERDNFSCNDGTGVGVASCVGTVANGAAINTSTLGAKTFTVTATDLEGKVGTKTVTYTVV